MDTDLSALAKMIYSGTDSFYCFRRSGNVHYQSHTARAQGLNNPFSIRSFMSDKSRACAVLCYVVVGIIWYFLDKDLKNDPFVKFHVKQAIIFFLFFLILQAVVSILIMQRLIRPIVGVLQLVFWIFGMVVALQGKQTPLPVIGSMARILRF